MCVQSQLVSRQPGTGRMIGAWFMAGRRNGEGQRWCTTVVAIGPQCNVADREVFEGHLGPAYQATFSIPSSRCPVHQFPARVPVQSGVCTQIEREGSVGWSPFITKQLGGQRWCLPFCTWCRWLVLVQRPLARHWGCSWERLPGSRFGFLCFMSQGWRIGPERGLAFAKLSCIAQPTRSTWQCRSSWPGFSQRWLSSMQACDGKV